MIKSHESTVQNEKNVYNTILIGIKTEILREQCPKSKVLCLLFHLYFFWIWYNKNERRFQMGVAKTLFGYLPSGHAVTKYTLSIDGGICCSVLDLGGIIQELLVPDANGEFADVVCGFDHVTDYFRDGAYHGALIGRVANRIKGGRFSLNGVEYVLSQNLGEHHHHGGSNGFSRRFFDVIVADERVPSISLQYHSPSGEEGYPADLDVTVTFTLKDARTLCVHYEALCDAPTPVNLSQHPYFNLAGYRGNTVCDHELQIDALRYLENDAAGLPTGRILSAKGTPMDFTKPKRVGKDIESDFQALQAARGFDHCYCFDAADGMLAHRATLFHAASGREMKLYTTQPTLHLYTANFCDETLPMKGGYRQRPHLGLCLETQKMPDSVHHPHFTNTVLLPGEKYDHTTEYHFSVVI